jgi:hypothetical protein
VNAVLSYFGGAPCPASGDADAMVEENADVTSVLVDCQECREMSELDAVSYRMGKRIGELLASPPDNDEPVPPVTLRGLPGGGSTPA